MKVHKETKLSREVAQITNDYILLYFLAVLVSIVLMVTVGQGEAMERPGELRLRKGQTAGWGGSHQASWIQESKLLNITGSHRSWRSNDSS